MEQDLKSVLLKQDKNELITILLDLANEYPDIEKGLLFKYAPNQDEISSSKKLIQEYINSAKIKGFIDWRHVDHALKGAELTLQKAEEKLKNNEFESAILLSLTVLNPVVRMLNYSDDSNGSVGSVIHWAAKMIDDAAGESISHLNEKDQKKLFEAILKEALKGQYSDWNDIRFNLLEACTYFVANKDLRKKLEKQLDTLYEQEGSSRSADYNKEQVLLLRLNIIERCDGVKEAERFIYQYIHHSEFRKKAIEMEFKKDEYKKVVQLCLDGEEADKDYRGLVHEWREFRYQAYESLGDVENQRQLARELLFKNEYQYYLKLKNLYAENEWEVVLQNILDEFERMKYQPTVYLSILKEENLTAQILKYCNNHVSTITDLYPYLIKDYLDEVITLFIKYIEQSSEEASERRGYRNVCRMIKTFKNACGTIHAHKLIGDLIEKYKRRPAFVEELGKIK